ncbi:MAG: mannosyltransferase, partial [Deltaproteobacteria bacterium]|nr:mannosyltransferase [Deltaproteobacteria bacterium]
MSGGRTVPPAAIALIAVCACAFAVRFLPARVVPNMVWPDEVFQSVEQAHRVVHGNGVVPWEFRDGLRSWLLPGALAGVVAATGWTSAGSSGYLDGVAAALSLLALAPVIAAFAIARRRSGGGVAEAVAAAVAVACWFELAYFGPKALAEVVAAHLLVAGLLIADAEGGASPSRGRIAWAGACLGLAVALRVHLAPAVLAGGAWLAWRWPGRARVALLAGAAAPIAVAGLLDLATWGAPFASYWNNFRANVLEGRSEAYGVADWDAYLRVVARAWWAGALLVVPAAAIGALRRPAWAATAAVVLVTHSLMDHKEYRFVFPA